MAHYDLKTQDLKAFAPKLRAGDTVTLTGTLYTARDAAHKRIVAAMDEGQDLPFDLDGAAVYYAGPTPEKPGQVIGSVGPTIFYCNVLLLSSFIFPPTIFQDINRCLLISESRS